MFQAERRAYARVVSCEKSGITGKSERQSMKAEAKVCVERWWDKTLEEKEEARPQKAGKT